MNFTQIRNVIAVAQAKSVSRAAEQLHVAQPSISKSIKALENELGILIFERTGTGMSLTTYGESWLRHARVVQSELTRGMAELAEFKQGITERVLVAGSPLVLPSLLPRAVARTIEQHPGTHFHLLDGSGLTGNNLSHAFEEGAVDMVLSIFDHSKQSENLQYEFLFDASVRLIVRKAHPLLEEEKIDGEMLAQYFCVGPPKNGRVRFLIDYEFRKAGLKAPNIQVETSDRQTVKSIVMNSDMIGFSSFHPACEPLDSHQYSILPVPINITPWPIGIITRISSVFPPAAEYFKAQLRTIVDSNEALTT